ncbi:unnamed protein product [Urochloa decumbens]|uniref:F-box domain-containing protein n=1 Tax=Urochloa decumbens TaxID=240449 RepID=A0ABC8VZ98_9POAL
MASARVIITRSKRARLAAAPQPADAAAAANDGVLPTEILLDILLRLPIRALCRLRLVCREWRSLTSDPGFARAHPSRVVAGVCKLRGEIKLVDLFSGDAVKRVPVDEAQVRYGHNLSAQADYVCVSETEGPTCVVNVATCFVTVLPDAVAAVKHAAADKVVKATSLLGRVRSTGEYKVLRTHLCRGHDIYYHTCDVIALDDGAWRARPDPLMHISGDFERRAVVNGVAYFLPNPNHGDNRLRDIIASFDLATEEWGPAMLHGPFSSHHGTTFNGRLIMFTTEGRNLQLAELDGCLVTVHWNTYQGRSSTDLWFLTDVDKVLWTKRYSVRCSSPGRKLNEYNKSFPLVILDDGRIVHWIQREQALRAYDPKTFTWADLAIVRDYFCIGMLKGNLLCSGLQEVE